ncbi:solute carrier family 40 member 1-like [Glandiceps talaboti]
MSENNTVGNDGEIVPNENESANDQNPGNDMENKSQSDDNDERDNGGDDQADDKVNEPLLETNNHGADEKTGEEKAPPKSDWNEDDGAVDDAFVKDPAKGRNRRRECSEYIRTPGFMIYSTQSLSAWGDRMWRFSVGLYLVAIQANSLRLAAIYGLCLGMSSVMFGALIGDWIDRNPRLRVVRISLLIQNSTIIVCAVILGVLLLLESDIDAMWNGGLTYLLQGLVIMFGCIANLASIANKISIQKDWVVVVSGSDKGTLANLNATIRRIDLVINIVAPIVVGQIMTFASMFAGTVFIASWNLVSGFVEYYLLLMVYKRVPALAVKKNETFHDKVAKKEQVDGEFEEIDLEDGGSKDKQEDDNREDSVETSPSQGQDEAKKTKKKCLHQMFQVFINLVKGWKVYMSYQVHFAGLGLAFLYMTVLGFNSITNGYAYSQGVPEWLIGVFRGVGSISGLLGTVMYSFLRKKIGLERTGLWAISEEILCLVLCVGCVWAPGSPFDLHYASKTGKSDNLTNYTQMMSTPSMTTKVQSVLNESLVVALNDSQAVTYKPLIDNVSVLTKILGENSSLTSTVSPNTGDSIHQPQSYTSVALFFTGIICARLGLWCFDLVVTQLLQENVLETQRGVVNGVQSSLNSLMDMLHFILVIFLPRPETFGILIILSFLFVFSGGVLYAVYCYKVRGHVMPFHNINGCHKETKKTNGTRHA